jgi:uncharacterized membrane protein
MAVSECSNNSRIRSLLVSAVTLMMSGTEPGEVAMNSETSHHHYPHLDHLRPAFGADTFGRRAETFARFFGTPRFLIGQSMVVGLWVVMNVVVVALRWDPYPFILLNLVFSLQAAYAAPLILLAQTRQADRDKAMSEADSNHREQLASGTLQRLDIADAELRSLQRLVEANTEMTRQVERFTAQIHSKLVPDQT